MLLKYKPTEWYWYAGNTKFKKQDVRGIRKEEQATPTFEHMMRL